MIVPSAFPRAALLGVPPSLTIGDVVTYKRKLLAVFCIVTAPLPVIGAQALWSVREQAAALRRLQMSLARARIFAEVESTTYRKVRKVRDYVSGQDPTARAQFETLDAESHSKLAVWKAATEDPTDLELLTRFEQLDAQLVLLARRLFEAFDSGQREYAPRLLQSELNGRLLPSLDATIQAIYASSRTRNVQRTFDEMHANARSTTLVLALLLATGAVSTVAFSIVIARNLARPVERLKAIMERVGAGEFDQAQAVDASGNDEISELGRAFVRMSERLKRAQEDLRQKIDTLRETQSQLVQSEKLASLGQMAAAVAHGLRNPLASIRAATQLTLRRLPPDSPLREHPAAVIDEVDRLEKRIVHLLDFTKPVAFSPSPTSVADIVEAVVRLFDDKIWKQRVELRVDVEEHLPEGWIDASQVEQAFIEVMANALEAMPRGGSLAVVASSRPRNGEPGAIDVTIQDSGEGIATSALPRVGEPFFTTKADGTGLGLAIAKRFVEQNKGAFVISSEEAKGTRVTITLPAVQEPGAAAS
jgi:signal transduction histidine kinase